MNQTHRLPSLRRAAFALLLSLCLLGIAGLARAATQIDILGPAGSGQFGSQVVTLANGNVVVTDPYYDDGARLDVGAVYLYDGASRALISTLMGSTASDYVGSGSVTVLTNGNFVVRSDFWDNGAVVNAGAVTWCSGTAGCTGAVSAANSLVGATASDNVGSSGVTALTNGNFVVRSSGWDNGAATNAGAVTWCSGTAGCTGAVSTANSLVGATASDNVGSSGVTALTNGNFVVRSSGWDNGAATNAGAVTWCSGTAGCAGAVSTANSLVGATANDQIGSSGVTALTNGNFVVRSSGWDNGAATNAGAVTWCSGTAGCTGAVSAANSLVGATASDQVGSSGVTALTNGNFVVRSPFWDNGAATNAGAVTWCSGTAGCAGAVSTANSLVGATANDQIGNFGVTALTNGNFVVSSSGWDNGAVVNVGAVTWCSGTAGCTGAVSAANSLVGATASDQVGSSGVTALTNGNFVVRSPGWDNGAASDAGAVTWCSGTVGCTGAVSAANSLVGSTAGDQVGSGSVTVLTNGNFVVSSGEWDNGAVVNAGAVTWCSGTAGCAGAVSAANSLVGATASDNVGAYSITVLTNGNFVVSSPFWDNGAASDAGAVTWCSGTAGCTGAVSAANSLVGSTAGDVVGNFGVTVLTNGNFVVSSGEWDNGAASDAGAVTWCSGTAGCAGAVSAANSLVGAIASDNVGSSGVTALTNGNFVVRSPFWDNGAASDAGAVTWCSGTAGCAGAVSAANSLVGSTAGDVVGNFGVTALTNGNFVVSSFGWDNGAATNAGAVTWCSGTAGCTGAVSAANSVLGASAFGGSSMAVAYDYVNDRLVVGRQADNIVSIFSQQAASGPSLTISGGTVDASGETVTLPVVLDSGGTPVAALAFSLDYDQACLAFDASDGPDADGLPDSITGLPAGYEVAVTFNAADTGGEIDISLYDPTAPIDALADGTLLSVTFDAGACNGGTGASASSFVHFAASPAPSFGDDQGQDVAGTATGASLTLVFNVAPSAILLSAASVAENQAPPLAVGTLSAVDANSGDSHTFSLVSGPGDTDNAAFAIAGSELRTAAAFDFEAQASYSVRVRATDGQGGTFEQPFTISVVDANEPITALALSNSSFAEGDPASILVGSFTPTDPDTADAHSYALVDSVTYPDNGYFDILGNELYKRPSFLGNYESMPALTIRVRVSDNTNGAYTTLPNTFVETFVIAVIDVNEAPSICFPNVATIDENVPENSFVANFTAYDPDAGDTLTLSLVSGTGDTDNAAFAIVGNQLRTVGAINYEVKATYSVRARVTDAGGLFGDKVIPVSVTDLNEAPVAVDDIVDPALQVVVGSITVNVLANDSDPDSNPLFNLLSVTAVGTPASGSAGTDGTSVTYTPPAGANGTVTFPYTAGDNGGLSDSADISLAYVADTARGDCNADTRVNAGDFVAIVLEIFDTDVSSSWWEIYLQGFAGSPRGCDANADQLILVADIICTVQVIFGNSACTNGVIGAASAGAGNAAAATLELGESQVSQGASPGTHSVPISLDGKGRTIAAAAFTLAWDPATASIDPTDNGADGIPDAVALNLPEGLSAWTILDNEAGTLQVAVAGLALPLPALADGELALVTFSSAGGEAPAVTLETVSLGDADGANVPVSRPTQLFLPAVLTR